MSLRWYRFQTRYAFSTPHTSLPLARNTGLKAGFNPVVIFLDDDTIPDANLIDMHRDATLCKSIGAEPVLQMILYSRE